MCVGWDDVILLEPKPRSCATEKRIWFADALRFVVQMAECAKLEVLNKNLRQVALSMAGREVECLKVCFAERLAGAGADRTRRWFIETRRKLVHTSDPRLLCGDDEARVVLR